MGVQSRRKIPMAEEAASFNLSPPGAERPAIPSSVILTGQTHFFWRKACIEIVFQNFETDT